MERKEESAIENKITTLHTHTDREAKQNQLGGQFRQKGKEINKKKNESKGTAILQITFASLNKVYPLSICPFPRDLPWQGLLATLFDEKAGQTEYRSRGEKGTKPGISIAGIQGKSCKMLQMLGAAVA